MLGGGVDLLWLLGADEFDPARIAASTFVVYQGHHGDAGAQRADVILPGAAYTEKSGTYVNTEGRVQRGFLAVYPPGEAREDWTILRAFSAVIGKTLPYDTIEALRTRLEQVNPVFGRIGHLAALRLLRSHRPGRRSGGAVDCAASAHRSQNYYQTDPISRSSPTMAACVEAQSAPVLRWRRSRLMYDFFHNTDLGIVILTFIEALALLVPLLIGVAYLTYAERKVLAAMQIRKGPNVVGPFGLLQPFADALKMLMKETIIPSGSNRLLFLMAPMLTFTLAMLAWAVIPVNEGWAIADINVGILYLFAISSLGVYGIIIAGWASNSKYAFLGAMRSAAQMVSYEVSMGFVLVTVLLCVGSLNLTDIVLAQRTVWFCIPLFPMFIVFFISTLAETNRSPFDLPEGESEIVAGFFVEYSAMSFALFFLGEYANMILMSAHDHHPVPGRLAAAPFGPLHLAAGRHLVRPEDLPRAVLLPVGARDFPALSLRPVDAAGLEGVPATVAGLAGADRRAR